MGLHRGYVGGVKRLNKGIDMGRTCGVGREDRVARVDDAHGHELVGGERAGLVEEAVGDLREREGLL